MSEVLYVGESSGAWKLSVGGAASGGDEPSSAAATSGSAGTPVSATGDVSAASVAGEVAPVDLAAVEGADGLGAAERKAKADGIVEPPPMPPEMELVPPLMP